MPSALDPLRQPAPRLDERDPPRPARQRGALPWKRRIPASTSAPSRRRQSRNGSIRRRSRRVSRTKRRSPSAAAIRSGWCSGPTRCSSVRRRGFSQAGGPGSRTGAADEAVRTHPCSPFRRRHRHRRAGGRAVLEQRPSRHAASDGGGGRSLSRPRRARCAQKRRRLPGRRARAFICSRRSRGIIRRSSGSPSFRCLAALRRLGCLAFEDRVHDEGLRHRPSDQAFPLAADPWLIG